ncbi:hypothetical protein ACHAXT_005159 [Thalassiosira profunda]
MWKSHNATDTTCKQKFGQRRETEKRYTVEWLFNNWHEKDRNGIKWHDSDLIIATSGSSEVVIAFAGTASTADALTNLQTLEPVSHSGLFEQPRRKARSKNATLVEGGIHRGFLNAYARVVRGKIRKINDGNEASSSTKSLDEHFRTCIGQQSQPKKSSRAVATMPRDTNRIKKPVKGALGKQTKRRGGKRRRRRHVCKSNGNRLMDILRDVTTKSLQSGHTVHLVGHSLAGSLAMIHALDIALNHPGTPIKRLHLWTFGAPEIADSAFFESVGMQSRRVRNLLSDGERYHRYVTQSKKNCKADVVASITSTSLNRGAMRRLGGVQGDVVHTIEPEFLSCNATGGELHEMKSYLGALSLSASPDGQLKTDFPPTLRKWLGEAA